LTIAVIGSGCKIFGNSTSGGGGGSAPPPSPSTPVVLGTSPSSPQLIVANSTTVYFTTPTEIYSLPVDTGGTPFSFAPVAPGNGDQGAYGLGLDSNYLYFTDYGPGQLERVLLASPFTLSTITSFSYSAYYAQTVAIAGGNMYWAGYSTGLLEETPVGGSSITQLFNAGSTYNNVRIATDSNHVYWTSNPNSGYNAPNHGGVYQLPLTATNGSGTISLATGLASPTSIAVTSGYVYWTDNANNSVETVPIGNISVAAPTVVASSETGASSIVSDSTAIYWVDVLNSTSPGLSTIRSCTIQSGGGCGTVSTLATVNDYVPSLAINGQALFWTEYYTSEIVQLQK
jgi:hypothetical protein